MRDRVDDLCCRDAVGPQERLFGKLSSYVNEYPEASQVSFLLVFSQDLEFNVASRIAW